jgi:hypothetical protein
MSSCPADWYDPSTRHRCEHPDSTYQDPLFDVPVTSYGANITYRNWHCALCNNDLDAGTTDIWSVYFICGDGWLNVGKDEKISHLAYSIATSSWVLNMSTRPELLCIDRKPTTLVYNCHVGVLPTKSARTVLRKCNTSIVGTCPKDWTDGYVRSRCGDYTSYRCLGDTVYRNRYCVSCNNNDSIDGLYRCRLFKGQFVPLNSAYACEFGNYTWSNPGPLPDFSALIRWNSRRWSGTCQQDTQKYDPLKQTCRTLFMGPESKFKFVSFD